MSTQGTQRTQGTRNRLLWQTGTGTRTRFGSETTRLGGSGVRKGARWRRRWRRSLRWLQRWWRAITKAITPLGWCVLAIVFVGAVTGLTFAWVEGWFVAVAGATLFAFGVPFLLGSRAYRIRLRLGRSRVVAGGEAQLTVVVENTVARPQLPAVCELPVGDALRELNIPLLGPHQSIDLDAPVPTARRGVISVGPVTVARRDPLGLLRREETWRDRHLLHVHPATTALPPNTAGLIRDLEGQASARLTDSDLSFHAVREYVPGDAVRHIHWKSTAKTGQTMVRQYEESQTAHTAVLFDARREEYASDDEFELGVSVAASISVQAVRDGRERFVASAWSPGRMRSAIDGLEELPARTPAELLDAWAELEHASEAPAFEHLARGLAESRRHLSVVVIVTGSQPTITRIRRAAIAFTPDVRVLAVRSELLADPKAQRLDPLTIATVGTLDDLPQLMLRGGL